MADSRPRVGISRCLLGDEVRYDGTHKRAETVIGALDRHVDWVPVCPEVEVGMGVPREPIQLVARPDGVRSGDSRVRLLGVETCEDWTGRMQAWTRIRVRELEARGISGYVLKARSPSCGVRGVLIHESGADPARVEPSGVGLFAQALIDAMPGLPIEDEDALADPRVQQDFLDRVRAHASDTSHVTKLESQKPEL